MLTSRLRGDGGQCHGIHAYIWLFLPLLSGCDFPILENLICEIYLYLYLIGVRHLRFCKSLLYDSGCGLPLNNRVTVLVWDFVLVRAQPRS